MSPSAQYPSLLMIIRHGEKPGDPGNDKDGGPDLSILGSARAAALPSLFTPDPTATPVNNMQQLTCDLTVGVESQFTGAYSYPPKDSSSKLTAGQPRFPTPNFLFATAPGTGPHGSSRPVETITPLAQALQFYYGGNPPLAINENFTNDPKDKEHGLPALVSEITGNPDTYGGRVVLICWHHGTIPQLTEDFGVPSGQLLNWSPWPPTVFDLVFRITWDSGQASLVVDYQQLLYGDTGVPVSLGPASSDGH
jgi:hypothetical protein